MKPKTLIFASVAVGAIVGLLAWGYAGSNGTDQTAALGGSHPAEEGVLSVTPRFYDFGTISMKNGNVMKEFTITNDSEGDVFLSRIYTSCMCTVASIVKSDGTIKGPFGMTGHGFVPPSNENIPAGESRTIRVVFDPNAHGPAGIGRIDRVITLEQQSGKKIQLNIRALVQP